MFTIVNNPKCGLFVQFVPKIFWIWLLTSCAGDVIWSQSLCSSHWVFVIFPTNSINDEMGLLVISEYVH